MIAHTIVVRLLKTFLILKDFWGGEAIDCIKKDGLGNRQQLYTIKL